MLRLYVMRHAKSSWAVPGARDFDRELNERGRSDLTNVAKALLKRNYNPDIVLCSPATRTLQTLDGILETFKPKPKVEKHKSLYSGALNDYLALLGGISGTGSVMTIGHNPMTGMLATKLASSGNEELRIKIAYKFPTAAIAVIDIEMEDWTGIANAQGRLIDLVIPADLR